MHRNDPSALESDGIPDLEGPLRSKAETGDGQDGILPPDRYRGAREWGTTAAEIHAGEGLDGRLAREMPEAGEVHRWDPSGADDPAALESEERLGVEGGLHTRAGEWDSRTGVAVGRIVEEEAGAGSDTASDMIGYDSQDYEALSAEEAAMHLESEEGLSASGDGEYDLEYDPGLLDGVFDTGMFDAAGLNPSVLGAASGPESALRGAGPLAAGRPTVTLR